MSSSVFILGFKGSDKKNANSYQIIPKPVFCTNLRFISALAGNVTVEEIWYAVPGYSEQERLLHITEQSELLVILTLLLRSNQIL